MRRKALKKIGLCLAALIMAANISAKGGILEPYDEKEESAANQFIICIDPGHQEKLDSKGEPVAPGSGNFKARVSAGTAGVGTKNPEFKINLDASLILRDMLKDDYNVIMTRDTNDVNISNIERAKIANDANANITIRIHCDSLADGSKTGATILIPASTCSNASSIYEDSEEFAQILKQKLKEENIKVNGIFERNDITGFNWSEVPVVILEMGFMSNYEEDKMLADTEYQKKMMNCVKEAIIEYSRPKSQVLEDD